MIAKSIYSEGSDGMSDKSMKFVHFGESNEWSWQIVPGFRCRDGLGHQPFCERNRGVNCRMA